MNFIGQLKVTLFNGAWITSQTGENFQTVRYTRWVTYSVLSLKVHSPGMVRGIPLYQKNKI